MAGNIIKSLVYIAIIFSISFTAVYLLNKSNLDAAGRPIEVVNPEGYGESVKKSIEFGDMVQIKGTPNLIHQVSQESRRTDGDSNERKIDYYYVALKEYGYDFIVRIKPGKLNADMQDFKGKVIGLSQTEFGTRIKNSLNKPINFDESVNEAAASELDEESQKQIADKSAAEFSNSTFLVLDEEILDSNQVYLSIAFWTIILGVFLITLFRRRVFNLS